MKSLKTKLACLFILACCMQILTASTASISAPQKSKPDHSKQVKPKKSSKGKTQQALYKSLLSHF
jgi:Na+-transporting methylmalonyl-CoA/oxaloacetate decarboxylase gamma subunit